MQTRNYLIKYLIELQIENLGELNSALKNQESEYDDLLEEEKQMNQKIKSERKQDNKVVEQLRLRKDDKLGQL